jgi:hypothetical protein
VINPSLWGELLIYDKRTLRNQQFSTEITKIMCQQKLFLINNKKISHINVSSLTVFLVHGLNKSGTYHFGYECSHYKFFFQDKCYKTTQKIKVYEFSVGSCNLWVACPS